MENVIKFFMLFSIFSYLNLQLTFYWIDTLYNLKELFFKNELVVGSPIFNVVILYFWKDYKELQIQFLNHKIF
jgi:hypothetical protein